jgi:hypothetical protein
MFQQCVRELIIIEEEARKEDDDDEEGEDDDDDDDNDDDDDDDNDDDNFDNDDNDFDDTDAKAAAIRRAKALHVPNGGYGEEEDCINAEDEAYREVLESMDKEDRVKHELGDAIDDEDDDDYTYTSPIENFNMSQIFLHAMTCIQSRDAALATELQSSLGQDDLARLQQIFQYAQNPVIDSTVPSL